MSPKKSNHKTKTSFDDIFDTQVNIDKLIEKAKKQGKSKIKIKIDGKEIEINLKENKDTIWNKILKITLGTAAAAGAGALAYYGYKNKDDLMKAVKDYYNTGKTKATEMASDITKFANKKYEQVKDYFNPKPKTDLLPYYPNSYDTHGPEYIKPGPSTDLIPAYSNPYDMHGPEYIKPGVIKDKIKLETGTDLIPYYSNPYDMNGPEYIPPIILNSISDDIFDLKNYVDKSSAIDVKELGDKLIKFTAKSKISPWQFAKLKPVMNEIVENMGKWDKHQKNDEFITEYDINRYKDDIKNNLDAFEYILTQRPYP